MTLGQKLKNLRSEKGITQKELADQLHVTFQTVSKWENDENEPDISTLKELSKLYGCSIDNLVNEDRNNSFVESNTNADTTMENANKTIIIHQKELHCCHRCEKDIPEDELYVEHLTRTERQGKSTITVPAGDVFYHKDCWEEVLKEREEKERKKKAGIAHKNKTRSFGWGIAAGAIAFVIALLITIFGSGGAIHPAIGVLISTVVSYQIFAMIYCILSGSYISDVFFWCAGLSIKFPGLIFSWSIEGFIWLIGMKILFAVLGFLIGVLALIFATILSSILGGISFPFVLIHNIRTEFQESL